jgi:Flp pilus assembly protein TadB
MMDYEEFKGTSKKSTKGCKAGEVYDAKKKKCVRRSDNEGYQVGPFTFIMILLIVFLFVIVILFFRNLVYIMIFVVVIILISIYFGSSGKKSEDIEEGWKDTNKNGNILSFGNGY